MSSKPICATKYQKDSGNEGKSSISKEGMKDCCWVKKKKGVSCSWTSTVSQEDKGPLLCKKWKLFFAEI